MKACLLRSIAPVKTNPLDFCVASDPEPSHGEVGVRIRACGVWWRSHERGRTPRAPTSRLRA